MLEDHYSRCVAINCEEFETVPTLYYIGDVIVQFDVTTRIRFAWKSSHELLPILTSQGISLFNKANVFYHSCSECTPV